MLKFAKARILGYVMNDIRAENGGYGYGYGYGYGSRTKKGNEDKTQESKTKQQVKKDHE